MEISLGGFMYKVEFTKEEIDASLIQIGARIDDLKKIQKEEAKKENVKRVLEMEEFMKPIISFRQKLMDVRFR
ncbi:hypothetical protein A9X05_09160 [Mycobacterium sp. E3298]|nr:hypothetical protein [Mycobacterium sp. E3298]OBG93861.1 hypothetical protein A9X05_09160 [Mycobacterium sp. E3298]